VDRGRGRGQVAHQQVADEARDVDAHRAALDAGGLDALDAALGLAQRVDLGIAEVDLIEAARALLRVALGHGHLVLLDRGVFLVGALALAQQQLLEAADVGVVGAGLLFLRAKAPLARHQLVEVDLVGVEVGPVDAGKFDLAVDRDAARPAHAGAVDHDGVQRHQRVHAEGARRLGAGAHHRHRADGHHQVGLVAAQQVGQCRIHVAGAAGAAVVGADDQLVGPLAQPVEPEAARRVAEAHDAGGAVARLLEGAQLREDRRHAQPAAHQHHVAVTPDVLRQAQRADEVEHFVALGELVAHGAGGLAQGLHHHRDGAAPAVEVGHRQRDAFALLVQAQHDEMPGLGGRRHVGRMQLPQEGLVVERLAADDGGHGACAPFRRQPARAPGAGPARRPPAAGSWPA